MQSTAYTYDNQNRLKTVSDNGVVAATYAYDANGNRASLTYGNGVSETYAYNKANWVTSVSNQKGGTVLSSYTYAYYTDGSQRTKTDNADKVTTYVYDGVGRLKSESESGGQTIAYTYDKFGNRTQMNVTGSAAYTVTYAYDANNRLTAEAKSGATTTYTYDKNGNQTTKTGAATEQFEYNGLNQLVKATVSGAATAYAYRPDGMRHSKTTGGVTTTHIWDGANIAADVTGTAVTKYVRGIGLITDGTQYYLYNGHGDVVQLTNASGAVTKTYDYDAFGVEKSPVASDANPWRYCGEYWDKETGTIYLRARYYSPATGRFTQVDPSRAGLNWYTYCGNNPMRFIDPWGLKEVAARAYAESNGATVDWTGNTIINGVTYVNATVTVNGVSLSIKGVIKNGNLMIDDSVLNNKFGWGDTASNAPTLIVQNNNSSQSNDVIDVMMQMINTVVSTMLEASTQMMASVGRDNAKVFYDLDPGSNIHAHHTLPQQFRAIFDAILGVGVIDLGMNMVFLDAQAHTALHSSGYN